MANRARAVMAGAAGATLLWAGAAHAQVPPLPSLSNLLPPATTPVATAYTVQLLTLLTVLSLAPAILILMTAFTRIVVVLGLLRGALGTQNVPPTPVIVGLALFLTFYVMAPVFHDIERNAVAPFLAGHISEQVAYERALAPLRAFMLRQTRLEDLELFVRMAGMGHLHSPVDVPTYVLVPAFAVSELSSAFQMGVVLYVPFVIIDLVVASTMMSLGMLMVPPVLISLPLKLLLFVLVNGWDLVVRSLVTSFR